MPFLCSGNIKNTKDILHYLIFPDRVYNESGPPKTSQSDLKAENLATKI